MREEPDLQMTYQGATLDAYISAYDHSIFSVGGRKKEGPPKFGFTVTLVFPNRDWDKFIEAGFRRGYGDEYNYKNHVEIRVKTKGYEGVPMPESGPPPASTWEVELEGYRYVICGGGYVCNRTDADPLKFKDKNGKNRLRAAVIQMLRDNPDALRAKVAEDYDDRIERQKKDVEDAERRLEREKEELKQLEEKSKRDRPHV